MLLLLISLEANAVSSFISTTQALCSIFLPRSKGWANVSVVKQVKKIRHPITFLTFFWWRYLEALTSLSSTECLMEIVCLSFLVNRVNLPTRIISERLCDDTQVTIIHA